MVLTLYAFTQPRSFCAGSVFTASGPRGGLVIICGTGSMAQLITPEGKTVNCGGWGHAFGDGASKRVNPAPIALLRPWSSI
jgi:hypothetical protein